MGSELRTKFRLVASSQLARKILAQKSEFPAFIFMAITVLLIVLYYYPALSGQLEFYVSDTSYFFEPLSKFVAESLKSGVFPLWNPYLYCGMAQSAVPSPSLFYPPNYLLFCLPFSIGLSLYMIFHQLLFGGSAYLLARNCDLSKLASAFAASAFSLMSYFFVLSRNPTLPATVAWLPLSIYLVRKVNMDGGSGQFLVRLGLCLSIYMIVGAGRPELIIPCFAALILTVFMSCRIEKSVNNSKAASLLFSKALVLFLSVLMAAPLILPALEWSALSPRAHGLEPADVFAWSANWYDFVSMLFSYPLGDLGNLSQRATALESLVLNQVLTLPFLSSCYLGPVIFQFAFLAFQAKEWKARKLILALLLFVLVLAAGSNASILPLLVKVFPGFSMLRYPVKLLVFAAGMISFAAAVGFDMILARKVPGEKPLWAMLIFWLLLLLFAGLIFVFPQFMPVGFQYGHEKVYGELLRDANLSLAQSMLTSAILGLSLSVLCLLYLANKLKMHLFAGLILLALLTSLYFSAAKYPYYTQAGFFQNQSKLFLHLSDFLEKEKQNGACKRILPLYTDALRLPENYKTSSKLSFEEKFYDYSRALGRYNSTMDFGLAQSFGYEAAATGIMASFFKNAREHSSQFISLDNHPKAISDRPLARFCKITGTGFVLTQESLLSDELKLPALDEKYFELFGKSSGLNSRIYRVSFSYPRFYFAEKVRLTKNWSELKIELSKPDEIPDDSEKLRLAYLLESRESMDCKKRLEQITAKPDRRSSCKLLSDNGQKLIFDLETNYPALFILTDQFYPGWRASIDGKPSVILPANLFSRAVFVPAGKHSLTMDFLPESLIFGFVLAIISVVFSVAVFFRQVTKTRAQRLLDKV